MEIAVGVLVVLVWWLVPPLLYRQVAAGPDAQLRAITDTRTALLAGLLGLAALLAFWLSGGADRNAACYAQAIEQLASDTLVVRLGGIYSLERIANVSARNHPMVMEMLSAFVRAHSHPVPTLPEPVGMTPNTLAQANGQAAGERQPDARQPRQRPNPTVDVRAALTVLGRLPSRPDIDRADLSNAYLAAAALSGTKLSGFHLVGANLNEAKLAGVDLERARLQRATLQGARLHKASLKEANLQAAHLEQADLERADLQGADLRGAWLEQANLAGANLARVDFRGAYLAEADLREAELKGANLNGVDLTGVVGLTRAQLDVALRNLETRQGKELELLEPTDASDPA